MPSAVMSVEACLIQRFFCPANFSQFNGHLQNFQVYEVDEMTEVAERDEDHVQSAIAKEGVSKRGWLYKAPSYISSSISIRVINLLANFFVYNPQVFIYFFFYVYY